MQFERLKKSHKKEILIALITICVIGVVFTFATSRAFYRVDDSIDLAKGTINYKAYDFKIMAMYKSDDKINYTEIEEMPSEGYTINEDKSYCNMSNGNKDTTAILKTIDRNHSISKLKKNDRCYIWFDKKKEVEIVSTILGNIEVNKELPDFSQTATTDEGIYATEDGMYGGTSYYWRGAVTNNYVKFAGFCWRIVRINGDGSIRLIYDGTTCHSNGESTPESAIKAQIEYCFDYDQSNYVGWTYTGTSQRTLTGTSNNAKMQVENWYSNNITKTYTTKIATAKYCNDRNAQNDNMWSINGDTFQYAGYNRMYTSKQPTLNCSSGDIYTLKIGLITIDEVMFAGGTNKINNQYYLYNGQYYWSMTPAYWGGSASVFYVNNNGSFNWASVHANIASLRPVINLRSDITFSRGNGTLNNPYVVS